MATTERNETAIGMKRQRPNAKELTPKRSFFSGLPYSFSASCPIATFLLRKYFPRPYKHTPEPEAESLIPEGKGHPRKLSKDKGSILRVWRAAWFPTLETNIFF